MILGTLEVVEAIKRSLRASHYVQTFFHESMILGISKFTCTTKIRLCAQHVSMEFLQVWQADHQRPFWLLKVSMSLASMLVAAQNKAQSNLAEHLFPLFIDFIPSYQWPLAVKLWPFSPGTTGWTHPNVTGLILQDQCKQPTAALSALEITLVQAEPECNSSQFLDLLCQCALWTAKDLNGIDASLWLICYPLHIDEFPLNFID